MIISLRRFLVFQAFLWWQGGFVFYAAVVVPIGTDVHGEFQQGLVTQRVTNWLNGIGVIWHVVFALDLRAGKDTFRKRRVARGLMWAISLGCLGLLIGIHLAMDTHIRPYGLHDDANFRRWHIAYLMISTVQWVLALANAWLTLNVWRK
jgi:hypothetical protein